MNERGRKEIKEKNVSGYIPNDIATGTRVQPSLMTFTR
jgi:hypothetical protein